MDEPPVDTSRRRREIFDLAAARALSKGQHWGEPLSRDLDPPAVGSYCRGRLRTAYVRQGSTWSRIGIHCHGCGVFWPDPAADELPA